MARRTQIWRSQAPRFDGSRRDAHDPQGQLHRLLDRVLGLLDVPQDGVGDGEQPPAFRVDGGLEANRIGHRLLVGHDHETIESARGRLVYVRCDEIVTKRVSPP